MESSRFQNPFEIPFLATSEETDPSRLFSRLFRWLLDHPEFLRDGDVDHRYLGALALDEFKGALQDFEAILGAIAEAQRIAPPSSVGIGLTPEAREEMQRLLRLHCRNTVIKDRHLIVLAFLVAIDRTFGPDIAKGFYDKGEDRIVVQVQQGDTIPTPGFFPREDLPPLQPQDSDEQEQAKELARTLPAYGADKDFLLLEPYFQYLTIPPPRVATTRDISIHRKYWTAPQQDGKLRIAVGCLVSESEEVAWKLHNGSFWGETYEAGRSKTIEGRLLKCFEVAKVKKAHILAFHELATSPRLEDQMRKTQATAGGPQVVISGRLHRRHPTERGWFINSPVILNTGSDFPWNYTKLVQFSSDAWPDGKLRDERIKAIENRVVAMDTPWGRLAILICLDFLDMDILQALVALRANLIVVPAMTPGNSVIEFRTRARNLATTNLATTVFSNSALHLHKAKGRERVLGFVSGPVKGKLGKEPAHYLGTSSGSLASPAVAVYELSGQPGQISGEKRIHRTRL